jgi:cohesin loading factor subunit SCC2
MDKKQRTSFEPPTMKSREREIADRTISDLNSLLDDMSESKDTDPTGFFRMLDTDAGELLVLRQSALARLSEAVSKLVNLGCFSLIPAKRVLLLQSLCEPLITATSQLSLDLGTSGGDDVVIRLAKAQSGLKACKLVLLTMNEGCDDRRICSEDHIQAVVRLLKHVLNSCIMPVVECRRTGSSSELFALVSQYKDDVLPVLRLCGNILTQVAVLIGKIRLGGITLSPIESLSIDIIFAQNGEKEADSVLGIQKFESFRQKAMDVLAQIFAWYSEQRESMAIEILNNLERLSDKRASARHFRSAREVPIMLVSALFMRFVQAAASNNAARKESPYPKVELKVEDSEAEDGSEDSGSEAHFSNSKPRKATNGHVHNLGEIAIQLEQDAKKIAGLIASTLVTRAENVSKSGDKPFRNLLDLFIEDLCHVLGSPEWPAASLFLESLLSIMISLTQNSKEKGVQAADMGLAAMGSMGVGIIDFMSRLRHIKRSLDVSQSELASKLVPLADDALKNNINLKDVLRLDGPYRVVLESLPGYLNPQGSQANRDDPHLRSLSGYYATSWANAFYKAFKNSDEHERRHQFAVNLEKHIKNVIMDPNWLSKE